MAQRKYLNSGDAGPEYSKLTIKSYAEAANYLEIGLQLGAQVIPPSSFQLNASQVLDLKNQLNNWIAGRAKTSPVLIEGDDL